jgi:hypothetical protein
MQEAAEEFPDGVGEKFQLWNAPNPEIVSGDMRNGSGSAFRWRFCGAEESPRNLCIDLKNRSSAAEAVLIWGSCGMTEVMP